MSGNTDRQAGPQPDGHERRKFPRKRAFLPARLVTARGSVDCQVLDFSAGGAKVECAEAPAVGESVSLAIEAVGTFPGRVAWLSEGCFGVTFDMSAAKSAAVNGTPVPALTPLGADSPAPARAAEAGRGSPDKPELPAPVTDIATSPPPTEPAAGAAQKPSERSGTAAGRPALEPPLPAPAGPKHRRHSAEFKRQIAQEFVAGETAHALAERYDISRTLIRIWVKKFEAGAFDEDAQAADLLEECEAKIAALERMVGRQALEIEFLKDALRNAPRPRSGPASLSAGPAASPSPKDAA